MQQSALFAPGPAASRWSATPNMPGQCAAGDTFEAPLPWQAAIIWAEQACDFEDAAAADVLWSLSHAAAGPATVNAARASGERRSRTCFIAHLQSRFRRKPLARTSGRPP